MSERTEDRALAAARGHPGALIRRNASIIALAQVLRSAVGLIVIVAVARQLGPAAFGTFAAAVAAFGLLAPFAGLGLPLLAVREAAEGVGPVERLFTTAVLGVVVTAAPMALAGAAVLYRLPLPGLTPQSVVLLAFAEVVAVPTIELAARILQARERVVVLAATRIAYALALAAAAATLVIRGEAGLAVWSVLYASALGASMVCALGGALAAVPELRRPGRPAPSLFRKGSVFGLGALCQRGVVDVDKVMLGALAGPEATGLYALVYRIASAAYLLPGSVVSAASPRIVRLVTGTAADVDYGRTLRLTVLTGAAVAALIVVASPLLGWVLGGSYEDPGRAAVCISWLPLLVAVRYQYGLVLIAAERFVLRMKLLGAGLVGNVVLNFALIPVFGLYGAILSTLATEVGVLVAFRRYAVPFLKRPAAWDSSR